MKTFQIYLGILSTIALSTFSTTVLADTYDVTFTAATPDNTDAYGQISVLDGVAISGYLDVTTGPVAGNYSLIPGSGGDSSFTYDNLVFPGASDGFLDSTGGLLWSFSGALGNSQEMNLWFNPVAEWGAPADSYSLWGGASGNYSLEAYGTADLTSPPSFAPAVLPPVSAADGGWTVFLLGCALGGLEAVRRNLFC